MKVLIGTPIHISKDYSMDRWLDNVAQLTALTPADLLLVDNSPDSSYVEKVKQYLTKTGITQVTVLHFDFMKDSNINLRIEYCQEVIRQYVLSHNYDAWFSWECDQIIPADSLAKLIKIMRDGNYKMVISNSWSRWDSQILNTNMGVTLISTRVLKNNWFLPTKDGQISQDLTDTYDINSYEFKRRVLSNGEPYVEIFGVIDPIFHLNR